MDTSLVLFRKIPKIVRVSQNFGKHLPQDLGSSEDNQQTKCIFINPIPTLSGTESLKEIKNLIKIQWSILTQTAT